MLACTVAEAMLCDFFAACKRGGTLCCWHWRKSVLTAWLQFNIRFYVIALIFLIFDVEVVFMFPWAVVFKELGLLALIEMGIFLFILVIGLAYVWVKSDLDWVKRKVRYGRGRYHKIAIDKGN